MILKRFSSTVLSGAIVLAVGVSSAPVLCEEKATEEQNLAMLKAIDADLAKKPNDILFQLQHAAIMGRLKRYDEQIAEASKLIRKDPKLREAYLIRSDGEANQKRYADAITSLDMAFELGAPSPAELLSKARYLRNEKKYSQAIEAASRVIAAEPSNTNAYKCRSACYFYINGPCAEALRDMEKVVAITPSDMAAKKLVEDLKHDLQSRETGNPLIGK